jgi:hypothetical protein
MGDTILWKYFAWLALFSSPAAPLAVAWRALLKGERRRRMGTLIPATAASASLIWFVAATMNFRFVGPLYGVLHYAVTGGNLGVVLMCALFCLATGFHRGWRAARLATCLACLMLAVEWTWLGIAYR